jgi:hypothetical protein
MICQYIFDEMEIIWQMNEAVGKSIFVLCVTLFELSLHSPIRPRLFRN